MPKPKELVGNGFVGAENRLVAHLIEARRQKERAALIDDNSIAFDPVDSVGAEFDVAFALSGSGERAGGMIHDHILREFEATEKFPFVI